MKKRILTAFGLYLSLLFCVVPTFESNAQSIILGNGKTKYEVGFNVGPTLFLGDLGGNRGKGSRFIKDANWDLTKIMKGVYATIYPNEWLGIRAAAQIGKLEASDQQVSTKGVDELWRKQRNLDFRSNIQEAYLAAEIFPIMLLHKNNLGYSPRLRPYGVIGVGIFNYNPQGSLTDANGNKTWYDLKPLHTEGQGFAEHPDSKEYSLTQVNIPMGGGIKYFISDKINISFEVLLRKSFTDYIDDVSTNYIDPDLFDKYLNPTDAVVARKISDKMHGIVTPNVTRYAPGTQRGNKNQNDSYFTTFIKFGLRLGRDVNMSRSMRNQMRCPARF